MEKSAFSMFKAREVAEDYVTKIFEGTCTAFAIKHVAVDPSYRCLVTSDAEGDDAIKQQSVCIFTVKYRNGSSTVTNVEYVSDKCLIE